VRVDVKSISHRKSYDPTDSVNGFIRAEFGASGIRFYSILSRCDMTSTTLLSLHSRFSTLLSCFVRRKKSALEIHHRFIFVYLFANCLTNFGTVKTRFNLTVLIKRVFRFKRTVDVKIFLIFTFRESLNSLRSSTKTNQNIILNM